MQVINALADFAHGGAPASRFTSLSANEGIARVRQSIYHLVQVVFEAPGKINGFDLQRQSRLPKKFLVMGQSIIGGSAGTFKSPLFEFCQWPDRLANRHETPARLQDPLRFTQYLYHIDCVRQNR